MDLPIGTADDLARAANPGLDESSFGTAALGLFTEVRRSRFQSDLRRMDKDHLSMDDHGIAHIPELAIPTIIPSEGGVASQGEDPTMEDEVESGLEEELMALMAAIDAGDMVGGLDADRDDIQALLDELRDINGSSAPTASLSEDDAASIDDIRISLIEIYLQSLTMNGLAPYADKGLRMAQRMLEGMEESDEVYGEILMLSADAHKVKFRGNRFRADIDAAITTGQRALKWFEQNEDDEVLVEVMVSLSEMHSSRHDEFREMKDRDDAIHYAREALRLENGGPRTQELMMDLGILLNRKFRDGDEREEGLKVMEKVLGMYSAEAQEDPLAALQVTMGRMLVCLDAWVNDMTNPAPVDAQIEAMTEELAASPPNSFEAGMIAYLLGMLLQVRYILSGDAHHIDKAVDLYQIVFSGCEGSNADLADHHSTLSSLLISRYERLGAVEDLDLAVLAARQAVDCTPIGSQYRPQYLARLSQLLIDRCERFGSVDNLQDAIKLGQICIDTADPHRIAFCHLTFANALYLRHKTFPTAPTSLEDLDRAIILAQAALDDESDITGMGKANTYYRLPIFLRTRYCHSREDLSDIDRAIEVLRKAVEGVYENDPHYGLVLELLGQCYLDRYHAMNKTGPDGQRSFDSFHDAWKCQPAQPLVRIRSAQKVGEVYRSSGNWADAAAVYEECVNLMPHISRPFLSRVDQQRLLTMLAGIASQAATCALEAGKGATQALRLLELGRGIIASFLIDCRSDMTDLLSEHPELYHRFGGLRKQMEGVLATPVRTPGFELIGPDSVMAQRKHAMGEIERVMETIRALPGYENFLAPPSGESLMALAGASGPIVVVNANEARCDAIMITGTAVESIKLDKWEWERANKLLYGMKDLVKGDGSTYATRQREMRELLIWLWDVVVSPVLAALGITAPPPQGGELPHIWWVGTGPLGLAPFHAAGHHMKGSTENTISRAISSYTPNIKALEYSRQKPAEEIRELLLLTMQKTEGQGDLDGVADEVKQIIKTVEPKVTTKQLDYPSAQEVLSSLGDYQAIHFACHGVIDTANPSGGGLLLQGGRLTVADVAGRSGCALIAYLSACSTAETADTGLVDEGITLAGAFQMAGFRHVLATMWEGDDKVCRKVAESFYAGIAEGHGVARALHDAVVKARGDKRAAGKVLDWAPFIHNGA